MGSRLSCSCPDAYCFGGDEKRMRIYAELFELSADGLKWIMVESRLLYIAVLRSSMEEPARITAHSQTGKTVLDVTLTRGQKVEKISECFVFWRQGDGRTMGVNTLSARDAAAFLSHTAAPVIPTGMMQHNSMTQVSILASWDGKQINCKERQSETTMVSINPLNMIFHYNHGLVNVDLLECFGVSTNHPNILHISYASHIYEFEFSGEAVKFITQVLNMSSLLLSRTTCNDVAVSYLQRQRMKNQDKLTMLKYHVNLSDSHAREKILLKDFAVKQRLNALTNKSLSTYEDVAAEIILPVRDLILVESPLASLFLIYSNMYNFRMWRKPVDVRVNDLKALCASTLDDILMTCPSSSADTIISIGLPNGKTTIITHNNTVPEELLNKVCTKLGVQADLFEMIHNVKEGWKLTLKEEYEVEKKQGKLGLTIYAYKDNGLIKAEVRGIAPYAPGGPAMGDAVISVDGKLISQVESASDVEKLLREGRVIGLRRRSLFRIEKEDKEKSHLKDKPRLRDIAPPPCEGSRIKLEEKLLRGIDELVQTEKKYVDDLKEIIDRFLCIKSVLDIMESAQRLEKMQVTFLDSLEEAVGDIPTEDLNKRSQIRDSVIRVCALFVNRCSEFKIYAEYAAAYFRLQQELPIRKDIMASLEAANRSKEQHCSYESKMIKPIQRLVQYPLLLRAIQAGCEKGSLEARQVEAALYKMQTLAEYVNEMQRIHEQYAPHIDSVRRANDSMFKEKGLRIDIGDLVIFAHIRWLNGEKTMQDYVVFVFHTVVLLLPGNIRRDCKPKWIRVLPINEIEVEDSKKDESILVITHVAFKGPNGHLSHGNPDAVYEIACCQSKLKQQLVKSIKRARTNFSKENRRPLSGSSLSDGGYGSDPAKERKSS